MHLTAALDLPAFNSTHEWTVLRGRETGFRIVTNERKK
jgi:hypothetical protein